MCINAICTLSILLSGISKRNYHFLALALFNFLLFIFHWLTLDMLSTNNIEQSIKLSKLHLTCVILGFPLYIFIFGWWTEYKHTKLITLLISALLTPLLFLNIWSDASLRYGLNAVLITYETIFSEPAYILSGEQGTYYPFIHLAYGIAAIFLTFSAFRFYKRAQTDLSALVILTIILQIVSSYIGYLIDSKQSEMVYVGGAPMTLLSLLVLGMISRNLKKKSTKLYNQLQEEESLHNVFSKLALISNEEGKDGFYKESIALLSEYAKADYVTFGLIDVENKQYIKTKIAFKDNQLIPNFTYAREGTPCENVLSVNACVYPSGVANDFPKDLMLGRGSVEAYIGYPILGLGKCTVGVLALLFKSPLLQEKSLRTVIEVFATKISAELRRETLKNELKATAYIDYLTQLPNRIKLLNFINKTKNEAITEGREALILLFDLDFFGEINRKFGYEIGDQVIKMIAGRLTSYATSGIFIARCNGDDFAVVIPKVQTDITQLANVHWTAIKAIINETCFVGSRKINVSCSMGCVVFPSQVKSNLDVVGSAEHALMQAKEQGRNKYAFFDPALLSKVEHVRGIESDLVAALREGDGLKVFYQPKVDINGGIIGAEALIRWFCKKRGFVSPAEFLPIAETSGIIHELGRWVLQCVLSDMSEWKRHNAQLIPISINITASQLEDDEFFKGLTTLIEEFGIAPELIELELIESELLIDRKKAVDILTNIRARGLTIALDDFGTGYSSLSYLSELPLDVLKIDKSFVDGLHDERNKELVKSIIAISDTMGLKSVAEGTESIEQVELLASYGCKYFQGFYFSKPINKVDFEAWLFNKQ